MPTFNYSDELSHNENFSMWRMMNESERLHLNCRLLGETEARELFDKYYPKKESQDDH